MKSLCVLAASAATATLLLATVPAQAFNSDTLDGVGLAIAYDHKCASLSAPAKQKLSQMLGMLTDGEKKQVLRAAVDWETKIKEEGAGTFCLLAKMSMPGALEE